MQIVTISRLARGESAPGKGLICIVEAWTSFMVECNCPTIAAEEKIGQQEGKEVAQIHQPNAVVDLHAYLELLDHNFGYHSNSLKSKLDSYHVLPSGGHRLAVQKSCA